ncbi:carbohydrate kinase [Thermoanaerobacterium sp. PSU-2]|uniref:carbohydrate kinase family protein n=1 Tax=Thermoanaerobacterium sp. PSU-2 TaxID=1930849 RepID=UPI000A1627A7|nr:sugar kinase [Thermoanaerobacterium sp. PSU-2]ORX22712.1 carbohydrate kinase [Thermoanaerobacterium sp. PSU-2]
MFNFNDKIVFDDKKYDVLTVGEMLVDMISTDYGDDFECDTYKKYFGGSPANIAINSKMLGINSIIVSSVGNDGLGKFLLKKLQEHHIEIKYVRQVDYSTSMVLVTKSKSSPTPIFYRDADYHIEYSDELKYLIVNTKIVHFSSWPISRNPSRSTVEILIDECKRHDVLVCYDPNYHSMIWERGHDGREYIKSLISKVDIIKPSEDDAERIFGKDTPENQLKKFLDLGAKLVILTLGKDGAIVSNGKETIRFNTLADEVVDTTGAGDAFWSGFYGGLIKGYTLKKSLELGFAVSAYKLRYVGAIVDLPDIDTIKSMYDLKKAEVILNGA